MRERLHVPFHSLAGSVDEDESPRGVLEQAETELSGGARTCHRTIKRRTTVSARLTCMLAPRN